MTDHGAETPPGKLPPRVRIAPSPTGDPHVGTAYIALFNYVFARKHGGKFILRIEDTDQTRSSESSEKAILEALRWTGLDWDEGPDVGGDFGPYRQSERTELYREAADKLLESGGAYRCFCTAERLAELRAKQKAEKRDYGYDGHCRNHVSAEEAERRAAEGEPHVLRLEVPASGTVSFHDVLRGNIEFDVRQVDDQILLKSDGFPTYHLANVVDDHAMQITHVIRGEDWITSTPKHVLLYQALGFEPPVFIHLNLLRNTDKSKLSKRKNPVSINHYRDLGYLPETFLNYLGTRGFTLGDDVERFSLQEMIDGFSWSKVSVGEPVFDVVKLGSFNADDIRAMSIDDLQTQIMARVLSPERLHAMLVHAHERIATLEDFIPYVGFFFGGKVDYAAVEPKLRIKKRSRADVVAILGELIDAIEKDHRARAFDKDGLEAFARDFCEQHGWKPREIFTLLRILSTGRTAAPPLFDTLEILGKDRVRMRLRDGLAFIKQMDEW